MKEIITPIEDVRYPGFYKVPGYDYVVISKDCVIRNASTGDIIDPHPLNKKGYLGINLFIGNLRTARMIHRLLALTFVPREGRFIGIDHDELQANHIDGVKTNNTIDNLEWTDNSGNIRHAYRLGLCSQGQKVLARDVRTNKIKSFNSIQHCADEFGAERKKLSKHLASPRAGTKTLNWNVFKYDDGLPWPYLNEYDNVESKWDVGSFYVGENVKTGLKVFTHTLDEMHTGLCCPNDFKLIRASDGMYRFNDWEIVKLDDPLGLDTSRLNAKRVQTGPPPKRVRVENVDSGEIHEFDSTPEASIHLSLAPFTIQRCINHENGIRGNLRMSWV